MTRMQYVSCATNTIAIGCQCVKQEWNFFVLATQSFWRYSKLSYSPANPTWLRRTLFEWIGMDWNDQEWHLDKLEWSMRPRSGTDSAQGYYRGWVWRGRRMWGYKEKMEQMMLVDDDDDYDDWWWLMMDYDWWLWWWMMMIDLHDGGKDEDIW